MAEVKESLRALYLNNDSSSFQLLLGFTEVNIFNKGELKDGKDEFFEAAEVNLAEENRPDDSKDDLHDRIWNIEDLTCTEITGSEDELDTETLLCSLCEVKCMTKGALRQHELSFHRREENFAEKSTPGLKANDRIQQSLHCNKCDKKFRYGGAFRRHKIVEHSENEEKVKKEWKTLQQNFQWPCKMCGKKFLDQKNCKAHMKREHIWPCEACGKIFLHQYNLRVHMKREHPVKRIVDEQEKDKIRREKSKIWRKRQVVCEHCSIILALGNLKKHIKVHERTKIASQQDFNCTMCSMGKYKTTEALQRHVFKCHSGLVYQCEFCNNTSTSPHAKRKHIETRHAEKSVKCNSWDMRFVGNSYLKSHIKTKHEKVKDKQCPHCGEAFQLGRAFTAHVNRHTDNRQFACETCGKSFLVHSHLKEHAKRHTLPYFCDECDSRFGSDLTLKNHRRIVHEQRQTQCRHGCGWKCWQIANRGRHEKSCGLNPLPGAPYTVSAGTASSLTLQVNLFFRLFKICALLNF